MQYKFQRNVIILYERAKFNMRTQEKGEPVDTFITGLAEHCAYGDLHDKLIRDRIVAVCKIPSYPKSYSYRSSTDVGEGNYNGMSARNGQL